MDVHENARLTPRGREGMVRAVVDYGATSAEAARRFNISAKTVAKWVRRLRGDCEKGIHAIRSRLALCLIAPLMSSRTPRSGEPGPNHIAAATSLPDLNEWDPGSKAGATDVQCR